MNIPKELFAGDSAIWDDLPTTNNLGETIDSSLWTLYYAISGAALLTLTGVAQGSGWRTTITKAQTTTLAAGNFYWQAYAEYSGKRVTLGSGRILVRAAAGAAVSGKSQIRQDLDAVQAAIRAMLSGGAVAEYSIGNRSLRKIPMTELITLESKLKREVLAEEKAEKLANGLGNPSNIFVRFK